MKAYCQNCETTKPASFRAAKDVKTGKEYEDLCCNECHYVIATVEDRMDTRETLIEAFDDWHDGQLNGDPDNCPHEKWERAAWTAAIHLATNGITVETVDRYECPIHGKQDGPDCARC